ncbi:MAG: aminoglycoside 6-adenylyltransferase [Thermoplasmataceae archaeon]
MPENHLPPNREKFTYTLGKIVDYVNSQKEIKICILVGSQARPDTPADRWSDIDLVFLTDEPERYLGTSKWVEEIAGLKPVLTFIEGTAVGGKLERRVLFDNGQDVDFSIYPLSATDYIIGDNNTSEEAIGVLRRGFKVIKDELGLVSVGLNELIHSEYAIKKGRNWRLIISQEKFQEAVNDFLYHFLLEIRKLRRGELWTAIMGSDCYMKGKLLQMIEWHMKVEKEGSVDIWHNGRFMEMWADESVLAELQNAFSHYDRNDIESGLNSSLDLYVKLARGVASKLGYEYPSEAENFVRKLAVIDSHYHI